MSAILKDAQTVDEGSSESDAAEALLAQWMKDSPEDDEAPADETPKKTKKVKEQEDAEDEPSEEDSDDSDDESPEDEEEDEEAKGEDEDDEVDVIEDDTDKFVRVKVDGEDRTVSVKDLKRLYGQEASLTRKSQEVAKKRKEAEDIGAKYVAGVHGLLQRAQQKAAPFKQIDFLQAAQTLEPSELNALRNEAQAAFEEERFLSEELNRFMNEAHKQRQETLIERGREAVKELKRDIPGWNDKLYNEVRHFAISSGLEPEIVDNLVDASAIKIIHKAMLFDKGKSGVVTQKKGKAPKKVIKTSKSSGVSTKDVVGNKTQASKALKKLKETGSTDAAAEAFLARWQSNDD